MCGIGGYFLRRGQQPRRPPPHRDVLSHIAKAIAHRGPDGQQMKTYDKAGFVHSRLAIIDIEGGQQPFIHKHQGGEMALLANGEIYNHQEIRTNYAGIFSFTSQSDCETILPLWLDYQARCHHYLHGMYAICIYDEKSDRGYLLRDPFGIKPLYYIEHETGVYFASEAGALKPWGRGEIERLAAAEIIDQQFYSGHNMIHKGIKRVPPGGTILIENGMIKHIEIYDAMGGRTGAGAQRETSEGAELHAQLTRSVKAHQMSDVPFGLFLSGGVDSSVLLAIMTALRDQHEAGASPLITYTARFETHKHDAHKHGGHKHGGHKQGEVFLAQKLAHKMGAENIDVLISEKDFFASLGQIIGMMDDPVADYAILPSYILAARARQEVKVILSGEGGDEFFAGYGRYRAGLRWAHARFPHRPGHALRQEIFHRDLHRCLRDRLCTKSAMMPNLRMRMFDKDQALQKLQAYDIQDWLVNNLLIKLDRCLMAHGIEGRTPFIDRELSRFAFHLDYAQKIKGRMGKYSLKQWLHTQLPEAEPFARKRGFTVPVGAWIASRAPILAELVARQPGIQEIVDIRNIDGIFLDSKARAFGNLSWRLLFYALWHQIHICNVAANQPIEDILASQ